MYLIDIAVTDTGIGIDEDHIDKMFEPYTQIDSALARKFGGTGLGLSISKKIIELLKGSITLNSMKGVGSVFTISVPFDSCSYSLKPSLNGSIGNHHNKKLNILVAEDNEINELIIVKMLENLGYECDVAKNGNEALRKAKHRLYDLIFMDLQMPELDGIETTKNILDYYSHLPNKPFIVAMTASSSTEDEEKCRLAGMRNFLPKPIFMEGLKNTIFESLLSASY